MSRATCCEMQRQRCCSVSVWRSHWRKLMRLRSSRFVALGYLESIQSITCLCDCAECRPNNYVSLYWRGLIGYHKKACVQLFLSSFTGEVFLYNSRNLSEPQHNESYSGQCRRESAVQAALLPQDHGAQAKQGTLIRSPMPRPVGLLYWWGCWVRLDSLT